MNRKLKIVHRLEAMNTENYPYSLLEGSEIKSN